MAAAQVLDEEDASVILAGPGGGKSSLLRTHLTDCAERQLAGHADEAVAVLVNAADLDRLPLAPALAAAVNAQLGSYGLNEELPAEFFSTPPHPGAHWLVLVDGLDELTDPSARNRVLRTIDALAEGEDSALYRFVVATRPLPGSELDTLGSHWKRHELLPFSDRQLPNIASRWFHAAGMDNPRREAARFVQDLEGSGVASLARIPLMASMLCQLRAARPGHPLPQGRSQIYRDFVGLLHKHQHAPGPAQEHARTCAGMERYGPGARQQAEHVLDHLHALVAHLAAARYVGNRLPAAELVEFHPTARRPSRVPQDEWRAFLDITLRRSGLLTNRAGELVFLHQTLLEYLAARHATRDPLTCADALRQALQHPARYGPFSDAPGVRPRLWFRRYWRAPPAHGDEQSYIGFLLDTAREADPHAVSLHLNRLASHRTGLHGCEFITSQVLLGTLVPPPIINTTTRLLHLYASDRTLDSHERVNAAKELANLGDPRVVETWHILATDPTLNGSGRVQAAEALAALGDSRATEILHSLATDPVINASHRLTAAERLAKAHDSRATGILHLLATIPTPDVHAGALAALRLAALGDSRATDLLHTLATTPTLDADDRVQAARKLADLLDPRAAETLHLLATDPTLDASDRVSAAKKLADLGDPRANEPLHLLATAPLVDANVRVSAARGLADLRDSRAADLLHTFATDPTLHYYVRMSAADGLAYQDDSRAAETYHLLATDPTLDASRRVSAAQGLADLRDSRAADLLHTFATDPTLDDSRWRMSAANTLAYLDDPRAAEALYLLATDPLLDASDRVRAAEKLADLDDPRAAEALYLLATDPLLDASDRVRAAEKLADLDDPRAAEALYLLATDPLLDASDRVRAAEKLADLDDPRAA
ncbi:hypothetical protein, partial [Streptomyces mirabilis]|uniref:hypothetical protein n=1 Tax=Streptomyces mirabilis TaxID=68239 RepID=UPI0035DF4F61